ncbi:MAG: response regulator transcription factor, partial [Thermoleophilia bacterium]
MDDAGTTSDGSFDAAGAKQPLRVMVVDDHELFRNGLRRLLSAEEGLEVVADARRGDEAVRKAAELRPDVIVMDVHMPGMSGIEATREVLAASPGTGIVILTISDNDHEVLGAVRAGASGYVLKRSTLAEITGAIRAVGSGESSIATRVTGGLLERIRRQGAEEEERTEPS